MKNVVRILISLFILLALNALSMAADADRKGTKDHPLLSRMPNFHIAQQVDKEFDSYKFSDKDGKRTPVEGHFSVITYSLDKNASSPGELKIVRNIQNALTKIGGKIIQEASRNSTIMVQKDGKETWVEVKAWANEYILTIVEKEAMVQEVTANAAAMSNDINSTGHVSVYGIYFDSGKSEIKPESDAALSEIAKLIKSDGNLKLYVVGHTDNVGVFDSNMKLSKDRADAVVATLSSKFGVAATRLKSHGVASLLPVTSNDTEEGKAKNRRVELVKQ